MISMPKIMFRGSVGSTLETVYSVPSGQSAIVTDIFLTNTSSETQYVRVVMDGVDLIYNLEVEASSSISVEIKQPLASTKTIQALATATSLKIHISGVEIS
jgi:hypothetical protein